MMNDDNRMIQIMTGGTSQEQQQQNPQSVGALLVEERAMNPLSVLPSFFEMQLVDITTQQGQLALKSMWEAMISYLEKFLTTNTNTNTNTSRSRSRSRSRRSTAQYYYQWMIDMLRRYSPEGRFLVYYWMEKQSLVHNQRSCASMAESIYGLKRSKLFTGSNNVVTPLSTIEKTRSALLLALVPYLQERFYIYYQKLQSQQQQQQHNLGKYQSWFTYFYPFWYKSTECTILLYQLAFLMNRSLHYKPSHHFFRFIVRRITLADYQQQQQKSSKSTSSNTTTTTTTTTTATTTTTSTTAAPSLSSISTNNNTSSIPTSSSSSNRNNRSKSSSSSSSSLLSAILSDPNSNKTRKAIYAGFASMILVGWWANFRHEIRQSRRRWIEGYNHRSTNNQTTSTTTTTTNINTANSSSNATNEPSSFSIPPPLPPKTTTTTTTAHHDNTTCRLCRQPHVNPVASTSGYVYCQSCLVNHIRHVDTKCPMTGMTCLESQIFRIYEPTSSSPSLPQQ